MSRKSSPPHPPARHGAATRPRRSPQTSDRTFLVQSAVVFVVALVIRLVHVWQIRSSPFSEVLLGDSHGYDEWAQRLAAGDWIGSEVFYQAPLYPYFLGVIYWIAGHSIMAVRLVQAVAGALSCVFLALAGRRFFSDRVGLAAGLMLAVYAPAIFFDGLLQKAVLDVFFLTLALWLLGRLHDVPASRGTWIGVGAAMGALALTRENALAFIAVILGWSLLWRGEPQAPAGDRRAVRAAAFVAGLAIVLLPVALRNYSVAGGFYLTTSQFGPNFYIGNNPGSDGTYQSLRYGRGAPEYERIDATELAEHALGRRLTPGEVSSYWTDRALQFITSQPGAWLALVGRKFALLWNATEMLDTESQESHAEYSWPLRVGGLFGHFGVLAPLAVAGAFVAWRERSRVALLYAMAAVYAATIVLFYVFARYRLALVPMLMLFAARAMVDVPSWIRAVRSEGLGGAVSKRDAAVSAFSAAGVVIAVTVLAFWPLLSKPLMRAITETNLGTAYQAEGKSDQALAHYRRAIEISPDYAPAYNNLAVTLRARGNRTEAIATYERALALKGDYPDAHYNLANALLEDNRSAEAAQHFEIALRSIPDSAGIRNNLGIALAAQGRQADALAAFRSAVAAEPNSAVAHRNLGDQLATAGQVPEAIAELQRAIQLDPNDSVAHYNLGSIFLEAGRLDAAAAEFQATLRIDPRSAEAHNNLGITLGSQGKLADAIRHFEQALAIRPGFTDPQRNLQTARAALAQSRGQR